jgi:hypothetical protein
MTLADFIEEPWKSSHRAYQESALAMSPAPEYASSEVLLASLYRNAGLKDATERTVPQRGRDLDRQVQKSRDRQLKPQEAALDGDTFQTLLNSVLESPKLPNQSSKRFLQVTPLVPQAAIFSGSARMTGNPWSAGALMRRMIWLGSSDIPEARRHWRALFDALSVTDDDDIFARFLQSEMRAWCPDPQWEFTETDEHAQLAAQDRSELRYPARQFVRDLAAIIAAKDAMTRRQWTSLLEAIVRLASVSHVVWICDVHDRIWSCIRNSLRGAPVPDSLNGKAAVFPRQFQFLAYGDRALPRIKDRASGFLQARLGINAALWALQDAGIEVQQLSSADDVLKACRSLQERLDAGAREKLLKELAELSERETRTLLCKKGIGSNIMEFARHALGQRQTANAILRGYDQGYILRKKGTSDASPWIVSLGPVAALAVVHCSLAGISGPRSVRRLSQHLAAYGIVVDYQDIATNDLGHQLRMLGLVLDSPDAESGMLLVPPFAEMSDAA